MNLKLYKKFKRSICIYADWVEAGKKDLETLPIPLKHYVEYELDRRRKEREKAAAEVEHPQEPPVPAGEEEHTEETAQ